MSPGNISKVTS